MQMVIGTLFTVALVVCAGVPARAADGDAEKILDKAIKAVGGEEKLNKAGAATWKGKGKITFGGSDNEFTMSGMMEGDKYRQEFEGEFGGMKVKGVTVINGDKGWRKFGDDTMELDKDGIANEKRNIYLQAIATMPLKLKSKGFKIETAPAEKGDSKTVGLKVTGPDGKETTLYFDKETGLLSKQVTPKVAGFAGDETTQETTYHDYKDFGGIKRFTKSETKRDGEKFMALEISEYKLVEAVDAKNFAEPK